MAESFDRLRRHLNLIDEGVAPVVERYRAHIQCRRGCTKCCHQVFDVSDLEGALLRRGLREASPTTRDDILGRARAYQPGDPCPVLSDEGDCRLYAHRPRICRKYGIPLWHPDRPHEVKTCELNFQQMPDIDATLILEPQAEWARDWIRVRKAVGAPAHQNAPIAAHLQR